MENILKMSLFEDDDVTIINMCFPTQVFLKHTFKMTGNCYINIDASLSQIFNPLSFGINLRSITAALIRSAIIPAVQQ